MGIVTRAAFTRWSAKGYGRELNWLGRGLSRTLERSLYRADQVGVVAAASARASKIEIPEMIAIPGLAGKSIMKGELTVGLFKQVMEGYEITGQNADQLKAILADPSKREAPLTYVSLNDAREFARRLSTQTGRSFRIQTEAEWEQARVQLSGRNWTWTETPHSDYPGAFILRHLHYGYRYYGYPERRGNYFAVRLVEDL